MKFEILEMIQKALRRDELLGRRFMASKPSELAHEHNHGILCLKCPENWHIGASCTTNECLHWGLPK